MPIYVRSYYSPDLRRCLSSKKCSCEDKPFPVRMTSPILNAEKENRRRSQDPPPFPRQLLMNIESGSEHPAPAVSTYVFHTRQTIIVGFDPILFGLCISYCRLFSLVEHP